VWKLHNINITNKELSMKKTSTHNPIMLAPNGGPTLSFMGMNLAYKATGDETDGTWALLEHSLPPEFAGPPLHWHKITYQGFYVLEGRVTFQIGTQIFTSDAGAFVSVPARTLHTFHNQQNQPARVLETIIPSGFENSFKEIVTHNQFETSLLLKPQKLFEIYKRYDTFMPEEL